MGLFAGRVELEDLRHDALKYILERGLAEDFTAYILAKVEADLRKSMAKAVERSNHDDQ